MAEGPPRVFMSYAWTTPEHEDWVVTLASHLRENGVDVVLDKWDLREGQDAVAFMESMVTDETIGRVVIVSDKEYKQKSDGKSGGVGTEAQIISSEIYKSATQKKYVLLARELDDDGKPYVPVYYSNRIHIPFYKDDDYSSNLEQLLRWVFDKPQSRKPDIGSKPAFLDDESKINSGKIRASVRRSVQDTSFASPNWKSSFRSALDAIAGQFPDLLFDKETNIEDDTFPDAFEATLPLRDQYVSLVDEVLKSDRGPEVSLDLQTFFEEALKSMSRPEGVGIWADWWSDVVSFVAGELYLYTVALYLQRKKYTELSEFLRIDFYDANANSGALASRDFTVFSSYLTSLEHRNSALNLRRISLHADLIRNRCVGTPVSFERLQEADMLLYLRSHIGEYTSWIPVTMVYLESSYRPLEMFARATSQAFFDTYLGPIIRFDSADELRSFAKEVVESGRQPFRRSMMFFGLGRVLNLEDIGTRD